MVSTVRELLLDTAWIIPSIILATTSQVIKHGHEEEIILFLQENCYTLEDYYWISSQIYFWNTSLSFISGFVF